MNTYAIHAYTINEVIAVGRDLLRLAKGRRLHRRLAAALVEIKRTHEALVAFKASKRREDDPLDVRGEPDAAKVAKPGVLAPMLAVKKSFAAFAELLRAHCSLPEGDETGDRARRLYPSLFPDGTSFLRGTAVDLDVECAEVLERAREKTRAAWLASLGCGPHLKAARRSLAELVAAREAVADAQAVESHGAEVGREAVAALREYARLVQAEAALEDSDLDRELLMPLANRRAAKRAATSEGAEQPTAPSDEGEEIAPPSRAA